VKEGNGGAASARLKKFLRFFAGMNGVAFGFLRAVAGLAAAAVANLLIGVF